MTSSRWSNPPQPKERRSVPTTWVSAQLLERTADLLRQSGGMGQPHEGIVYWAGRRVADECFVTTCIAPAARTTWGSFSTSSQTNAKVVMYLAGAGLELLGQVHSHPGKFVDHSDGDDDWALMPYDGFFSIVVPDYAQSGMQPLTTCGVHIFDRSRFRRLADREIEACFRVVDDFADLRT